MWNTNNSNQQQRPSAFGNNNANNQWNTPNKAWNNRNTNQHGTTPFGNATNNNNNRPSPAPSAWAGGGAAAQPRQQTNTTNATSPSLNTLWGVNTTPSASTTSTSVSSSTNVTTTTTNSGFGGAAVAAATPAAAVALPSASVSVSVAAATRTSATFCVTLPENYYTTLGETAKADFLINKVCRHKDCPMRSMSDSTLSAYLGYSGKNGPRDIGNVLAGSCFNLDSRVSSLEKELFSRGHIRRFVAVAAAEPQNNSNDGDDDETESQTSTTNDEKVSESSLRKENEELKEQVAQLQAKLAAFEKFYSGLKAVPGMSFRQHQFWGNTPECTRCKVHLKHEGEFDKIPCCP